jgi:glycosyltransferase involved in cell wall biosynthesis
MNILFLLRSLGVGGVEVVSITLANKFAKEGHNVSIFAREYREKNLADRLSPKINVYIGFGDTGCSQNIDLLHKVYVNENIEIVVNQWGLPYMPIRLARDAERGHKVKIISFHHNDPATNGKLNTVSRQLIMCHTPLKRRFLLLKRSLFKWITSHSMKYTYRHSDMFMVLSESYLSRLRTFIRVPPEKKQGVLTNPITIENNGFTYAEELKKKQIIFCGRMDDIQKCPKRVLDVWEFLYPNFSDWELHFVGDGPDKISIEEYSQRRNLKKVFFEGFQNPLEYYKNASILVMTSDFEGFPLVLAECMSFGVIPCVYGSFAAVYDIVENGKNGIIVGKDERGCFSASRMANYLQAVMGNAEKRVEMAQSAIETSKRYGIDVIYRQWCEVFASFG